MQDVPSAVIVACAAVTLVVTPARSQTITGVIRDSAGHVIPGAEARLASMDARTVAATGAGANGAFSITAPRTEGTRRYWAELCAPGYAPQVEVVPMAPGDTLVVRGELKRATSRIVPMGAGACAWDAKAFFEITGGHGFAVVAARTTRLASGIVDSLPRDSAARAIFLRTTESRWLQTIRAARDPQARARAAWVALQLAYVSDEPTSLPILSELRRALPPTSPWWHVGNGGIPIIPLEAVETLFGIAPRDTSAATLGARRRASAYVARIAAAKYDPDVDAQQRYELAVFALGMRDTALANAGARALIAEYPGYTAAKLTMFRLPWLSPLREGSRMPGFDFAALRSSPQARITNRDLRAPYTLLVFWGTWCEQCLKELPQVDSLHTEYHAHGLDIMSVAGDDSPEVVSAFIQAHGMPWRQAYAGTAEDPQLQRLGVFAYPTAVVVDSTGTIRASRIGLGDLRAMVAPLLNR